MKLQKHGTKKGTNYFKWEVIIPNEIVEKAGFKEGEKLEADVKKGEIKLKRRKLHKEDE